MITTPIRYERRVEVRRVTEFRDGCIYRTEHVGFAWVPAEEPMYALRPGNLQYVTCSDPCTMLTIRRVR